MQTTSKRSEAGAAAVEFAILLPLLIVLVFGIWQFSMAYNRSQALSAGVREGARLAAEGSEPVKAIETRVLNGVAGAPGSSIALEDLRVHVRVLTVATAGNPPSDEDDRLGQEETPCQPGASDELVRVDIYVQDAEPYQVQIPLLPPLPNPFTSPRHAVFRCLP